MRSFLVLLIILIFCSVLWAHFPEGVTFMAFQWPSDYEPKIDGDLSEWNIVPEKYVQRKEQYFLFKKTNAFATPLPPSSSDFEDFTIIRSVVGWSKSKNKLYFAAEILDNFFQSYPPNPKEYNLARDSFRIMVDADHSGGEYIINEYEDTTFKRYYGAQATQYVVMVPPIPNIGGYWPAADVGAGFFAFNAATWVNKPPWAEYGWRIEGQNQGKVKVSYEVGIIPFDDLNWEGSDQSKVHNLKEGEIIGVNLAFEDFDFAQESSIYWQISNTNWPRIYAVADRFSDFLLFPVERGIFEQTLVKPTTWARIKALFLR